MDSNQLKYLIKDIKNQIENQQQIPGKPPRSGQGFYDRNLTRKSQGSIISGNQQKTQSNLNTIQDKLRKNFKIRQSYNSYKKPQKYNDENQDDICNQNQPPSLLKQGSNIRDHRSQTQQSQQDKSILQDNNGNQQQQYISFKQKIKLMKQNTYTGQEQGTTNKYNNVKISGNNKITKIKKNYNMYLNNSNQNDSMKNQGSKNMFQSSNKKEIVSQKSTVNQVESTNCDVYLGNQQEGHVTHQNLTSFINNLKYSNSINQKNNQFQIKKINTPLNINNNIRNARENSRERATTTIANVDNTNPGNSKSFVSLFGNLGVHRYKIEQELGKGSFATVKLAKDNQTTQFVALKCYPRYVLNDPQKLRNVKREISILSRMNNEFVIKLLDSIEERTQIVLVMEFAGKMSLKTFLKQRNDQQIDEQIVKKMIIQLVEGIKYCHDQNVVHRDMKSDNIIMDTQGNLKIIDFGFAVSVPKTQKLKIFCGTPQYMSPEIAGKQEYCGYQSDIWALGILIYQMAYGKYPFKGINEKDLFTKIKKCKPDLPSNINPQLRRLIQKLLVKNPEERLTADQILEQEFLQKQDQQ